MPPAVCRRPSTTSKRNFERARGKSVDPNALNGVMVDYFGSQVPVSGAASVTVPDAKTILIQPWDKNMLRAIEKAIIDRTSG